MARLNGTGGMSSEQAGWESGLECASATDVGMRRSNNQDSHRLVLATTPEQWHRRGHLMIVADGMGAHAAGEKASEMAASEVPHLYAKYLELSPPEALQKAIIETNGVIHRRGQANTDFHNMGTTASTLVLLPQGALLAHVGDSRVYRLTRHALQQLTFDHSLVWEMRAAGQIPKDDRSHSIPKNVITRSLGPNERVQVDIEGPLAIDVGDVFLLCSDGLTGQVSDEELAVVLAALPPKEAAETLVDFANLRGGPDNTTVIVAKVVGGQQATAGNGARPLEVGRGPAPEVPASLWLAPALCILLAGLMWLVDQPILSLLLLIASLIAVVFIAMRSAGGARGTVLSHQRRLGRGPYVEVPNPGPATVHVELERIARALRQEARERYGEFDVSEYERILKSAQQAPAEQAGRHYGEAIRALMRAMRESLRRKARDSDVEL